MKILYVTHGIWENGHGVDMLNDMIFHGLFSLYGDQVIDSNPLKLMYKEFLDTPEKRAAAPYKGFTVYGNIDFPHDKIDRTDLENKIKNKYFDYIIYGSIWRCDDYLDIVTQKYSRDKIIMLDGEDHFRIRTNLAQKFKYFKRELTSEIAKPVGFCIPEEKIVSNPPEKTRKHAFIIPGQPNTYIYETEDDYYKGYQESYYGITMKKEGWDCMRHYEILANYCAPMFLGLEKCPPLTMTFWPKALNQQIVSAGEGSGEYWEMLGKMMQHMRKNLTTTSMAKYILEENNA